MSPRAIKLEKNLFSSSSPDYSPTRIPFLYRALIFAYFITNYKKYSIPIKAYETVPILELVGIPFMKTIFIFRDTCGRYYRYGNCVLKTQKQYGRIGTYMLDSTSIYLLKYDTFIYRYDFQDLVPKEK